MVAFRKSQKIGPFRLTLTPRGVSTSVGVKGARVGVSPKGRVTRTLSIPGTGIYDRKVISGSKRQPARQPQQQDPDPEPADPLDGWSPESLWIVPTAAEMVARPAVLPPAGWFPDPLGRHQWRWWDGRFWWPFVADDGAPCVAEDEF